jgi:hypothetical protein
MTYWPTLRVEIDSAINPKWWLPSGQWTRIDEFNRVLAIDARRGQETIFGPVEPGRLAVVMDNRNGWLDPGNPASPYKALLTQGRVIRFSQIRNDTGVAQTWFTGNTSGFPTSFAVGERETEIEVFDLIGALGEIVSPSSLVEYELQRGVRYPRPTHLFMLRESETAEDVALGDDFTDYEATPVGTPSKGSGNLIPYSDISGLKGGANANKGGGFITVPQALAPVPPWTYLFVVSSQENPSVVVGIQENYFAPKLRLGIFGNSAGNGVCEGRIYQADGALKAVAGTAALDNQLPHMLAMTDTGTALTVYVDGASIGSIAHTTPQHPANPLACAFGEQAEFAMECIWGERILADKQALIWDDIRRPWFNQYSHTRIERLLDLSMPGSSRNIDIGGGTVMCLPVSFYGRPLLDILRRTTESADGKMWADRENTFQSRNRSILAPSASVATYDMTQLGGGKITGYVDPRDEIVTHAIISNGANVLQRFHSTDASERRGEARLEIGGLVMKSPQTLWDLAERTVHYRSNIEPFVSEIELYPADDAVGYDNTLALELYTNITLIYRRPWIANPITQLSEIIGIANRADSRSSGPWRTILKLRPPRKQRFRMSVGTAALNQGSTTPDSIANSVTGDIDIRVRFFRNVWSGAGFPMLIGKDVGVESYMLHFVGSQPEFVWRQTDGVRGIITAPLAVVGARPVWLRATLKLAAPYQARLYQSADGNDWRLLKEVNGAAGVATSLRDTALPLSVGIELANGVRQQPLNGRVLYAEIRNGIDGPVAVRFDPNESTGTGAASWVASTGETWTMGSAATVEAW